MWLCPALLMYIKQCCCGSHDPRQVQVPPVDDAEGIKQYRLSTKCHFSSSWEGRAPLAFVALRRERRWRGSRKNWEVSFSVFRKVHCTDFLMALISCRLGAGRKPPRCSARVKTNTEKKKRWPPSSHWNIQLSVNGRVPPHTVYHTILQLPYGKSHVQATAPYNICTGLIERIFWIH